MIDPAFTWGDDRPPRIPWHKTVIYELHVKGFTQKNPLVPGAPPGQLRRAGIGIGDQAPHRSGSDGR